MQVRFHSNCKGCFAIKLLLVNTMEKFIWIVLYWTNNMHWSITYPCSRHKTSNTMRRDTLQDKEFFHSLLTAWLLLGKEHYHCLVLLTVKQNIFLCRYFPHNTNWIHYPYSSQSVWDCVYASREIWGETLGLVRKSKQAYSKKSKRT